MNKQELVESFWMTFRMGGRSGTSRRLPITRTQAGEIVNTVLSTISEALENDQEVRIPRFGGFVIKRYPEGAMVMDIKSRQKVLRPSNRMKTVRFKPSQQLVERVNAGVSAS
ncbi:MAG: HU family DNA-binding protein [Candidatus Liptonbacteria bacterium]|nr:HU family DNA-binding protein [Candidatus Liptonbacteria bacterium]